MKQVQTVRNDTPAWHQEEIIDNMYGLAIEQIGEGGGGFFLTRDLQAEAQQDTC